MAAHLTISKGQSEALNAFLDKHLPESIDDLVEQVGQDHAFKLLKLKARLNDRAEA